MIRLIKPYISFDDVHDDFKSVFDSGMFSKGQNLASFAEEFCEYTGAKHTFLTTSATTALWAALKLLNIDKGDEVLVSDFSFPASSNVVEDLGATPVFVDVNLDTYNMLAEDLEAKITSKTKAVMFVDALGNPSGLHAIKEICKKHNLPLIEDAACAIGSSENGVRCGNIADITCFSFHPRKLMCTGEGGAITTNNDEWAKWFNVKLNHGADGFKDMALDFPDYGYNFRLSELQAVMGRKQLPILNDIIKERIQTQDEYIEGLEVLGFKVQVHSADTLHNVQSLAFTVPEGTVRNELVTYLKEQGVESTIGTYALSNTTYYKNKYNDVQPNAKSLFENVITLPCFTDVDTSFVIEKISSFYK